MMPRLQVLGMPDACARMRKIDRVETTSSSATTSSIKTTNAACVSYRPHLLSFVLLIVASRSGLLSPHHRLAQEAANIEKINHYNIPEKIYFSG